MQGDDLYGLPLDRFVPERTALAKALRAGGEREEAARVTKLRKPSVAAWAVNQLVRTQSQAVKELFEAGDALQRAQSELLAGRGDAQAMRKAGEQERSAVGELTAAARGLLSSQGHELTASTLDRVSDTLHAAAFDEEARAQVREGTLEKELRHVGLGGTGGLSLAAPPSRPPRRRKAGQADQAEEEKERAARERAEQRAAATKAEAEARRLLERAARERATAQSRRDRAADALDEADGALAAAAERVEEAERAHRRAREALERL
jgi:hypothetical protein